MDKIKYFINLTNGIEFVEDLISYDIYFVRIQSTACEQKRWEFILNDLDYTFLMYIALGYICIVLDTSAHKQVSRALWQGLEWIKFVLNKVWFDREEKTFVRKNDVTKYFKEQYNLLDKKTLKRLKYFRKFLNTNNIDLRYISKQTMNDGNYKLFNNILIHKL